jgi:hypothetical protein
MWNNVNTGLCGAGLGGARNYLVTESRVTNEH